MKRVLFLVNHDVVIYNFRLEIVERLLSENIEVHISSPYGERIDDLIKLGCIYHPVQISRHGKNPISELKLLNYYKKLYKDVAPDIVLGFTIKPNIYGAIEAEKKGIPFVANITGLGTAVENNGIMTKIYVLLYKYAFRKIQKVFFQNEENQRFFTDRGIAIGRQDLLPGSGVNLSKFSPLEYPNSDTIEFAFISRIMREKGIDQYLEAAEAITKNYPNTKFHICGFCEDEYKGKLDEYIRKGVVIYHGMMRDVREILKITHCTVHPSYYPEGLSNVLLESSACARPIITTDRSGCREVIIDGVNGFITKQKDAADLISKINTFIELPYERKKEMGLAGREYVEKRFDRRIVVDKYMQELAKNK